MKRYKILITNHGLQEFRGSETYCYTISKELSKYHNVHVYSPKLGKVSERIKEFAEVSQQTTGDYDIILFNHNNTVHDSFNAKCKIYTIHGIFPELEKPPENIDRYVAISHEIAKHYNYLEPTVIYNGIECDVFQPEDNIEQKKEHLLYSSNAKGGFSRMLYLASLSLGLKYRRIGRKKSKKNNVLEDLQWADIVVGLGRTALEGLACNKKVIVADKRFYNLVGMDGLLTPENIGISKEFNYSGRAFKKKITFLSLREEIKKAINDGSSWERDWILANHDIKNIAADYISLAETVLNSRK